MGKKDSYGEYFTCMSTLRNEIIIDNFLVYLKLINNACLVRMFLGVQGVVTVVQITLIWSCAVHHS